MRTRSPSNAPPENGEDGSTASTPTRLPLSRYADTNADVIVDLPTPGEPVKPMTRARPAYFASNAIASRNDGAASSTSEISRATDRGSPATARSTTALMLVFESVNSRRHAEHERVALPAATAQRRDRDAAPTPACFERHVQRDAGTA